MAGQGCRKNMLMNAAAPGLSRVPPPTAVAIAGAFVAGALAGARAMRYRRR
jgi:uncharacterized protein involved in exopolysaccharide biosynthesis